uniref:Uncharacterized protein n=1 Tax=Rhizophora mucronata TaxID=61149 RepID=A0A2P2IYG9_RHIMU
MGGNSYVNGGYGGGGNTIGFSPPVRNGYHGAGGVAASTTVASQISTTEIQKSSQLRSETHMDVSVSQPPACLRTAR